MKLRKVRVTDYKCINDSGWVNIDQITCFVGKNESGKTAFLKAISKLNSPDNADNFKALEYPRDRYANYKKVKDSDPATVITAVFDLSDEEVKNIEESYCEGILNSREIVVSKNYKNILGCEFDSNEKALVKHIKSQYITDDIKEKLTDCNTIDELHEILKGYDNGEEKVGGILKIINNKFINYIQQIHDELLEIYLPKFVYYGEYSVMPGIINISQLKQKRNQNTTSISDKTILALFDLAGLTLEDFEKNNNYEELKADLESASISISDEVFKFWSQNKNILVNFDTSNGAHIHIRILNTKHRVTVPFDQRSKGFVWFFSFLSYFSQIKDNWKGDIVLLLDEPGLSLHASAQNDFLCFIEKRLSQVHQVLYTTHSPFLIDSNNIDRVRTVQDIEDVGTKISSEVLKNDKDTVFPLQAALGYSLAQTLFLGPNCLLVEGPSDMIYLQVLEEFVESKGGQGLNANWVIVPVGGADKLATFVSLLGSNNLNIAILMDITKKDKQRIDLLKKNSMIKPKNIITISEFTSQYNADIEDIFDEGFFIGLVNKTYSINLTTNSLEDKNPRIIKRISKYFSENNIAEGRFNHYKPAVYLQKHQSEFSEMFSDLAFNKAQKLFSRINDLLFTN